MHGMIAVRNQSSELIDAAVKAMTDAVRKQVWWHVCPLWGLERVPVTFYPSGSTPPPGVWEIAIFDHADQAGALGYHDRTPDGLAFGRVFVHPSWDQGIQVSSVLSHEVIEAVGDPVANRWADNPADGYEYALELCDPCQDDIYHDGRGVALSDFVLPAWFNPDDDGPFTYRAAQDLATARIVEPFGLSSGGYAIRRRHGAIGYTFGRRYPEWRRAALGEAGSRTGARRGSNMIDVTDMSAPTTTTVMGAEA